jgi:hypothetical protein
VSEGSVEERLGGMLGAGCLGSLLNEFSVCKKSGKGLIEEGNGVSCCTTKSDSTIFRNFVKVSGNFLKLFGSFGLNNDDEW